MYFRHLYARCQPDLRQRCESWDNYVDLFGLLLHSNVNMQLPNIWLWDMIDEFIYQFQVRGEICPRGGPQDSARPARPALRPRCWLVCVRGGICTRSDTAAGPEPSYSQGKAPEPTS